MSILKTEVELLPLFVFPNNVFEQTVIMHLTYKTNGTRAREQNLLNQCTQLYKEGIMWNIHA